ncbi:hypothetical protein GCM10023211_16760 [Orbus sasakiae]|uniref:Uncharacterized protein n=1 Tax=Orbus sasakiae TaxID=1078475 RepID=A0ABP9N9J5_9GAMM
MTNTHSTAKTAKTKTTGKPQRETSQRHYTVGYISVRHEPKAAQARTHYSPPLCCILKAIGLSKSALPPANQ